MLHAYVIREEVRVEYGKAYFARKGHDTRFANHHLYEMLQNIVLLIILKFSKLNTFF